MHTKIFFLLVLLLPAQLGYHMWPGWAFVLGRRVDYLSPTLYLTDLLIVAIFIAWFIELPLRKVLTSRHTFLIKQGNVKAPIFKILAVLVYVAVNIVMAESRAVAAYKWLKFFEFVGLGLYIIKTRPSVSRVAQYATIGILYSSAIAIGQFIFQKSIGGPLWFLGERTFTTDTPGIARLSWCLVPGAWCRELLRPYGTFPHPNVLGGFLAAMIPLAIFEQKKKFSFVHIAAVFLGLIALFLTFSRSAWIAGTIAVAFTIAKIRSHDRLPPGKEFGITKKIMWFMPWCVFIFVPYVMFRNLTDEGIVMRIALNDAAVRIWKESPLFGVGFGNFLVRLPDYLVSRQTYFLQPVHNIYLLMLAEIGIVGLLIFLWFVVNLVKKHDSGIRNTEKEKKNNTLGIEHSLFTLLLLGFVDHYLLTLQQGQILLTLLVGLSLL